jgi:hypothetical protein
MLLHPSMEDRMTKHGIARCVSVLLVGCVSVGSTAVVGQTNPAKMSAVGTWKLDMERSQFASGDAIPQSMTLTILTDTPDSMAWRVDMVTDEGNKDSYHWSGPKDGSMHPVQDAEGHTTWQASLRNDHDALIRHMEFPDGGKADARATMSADGNTITDEVVAHGGEKTVYVMHRSPGNK